jgi:fumarate hydratase class I
MGKKGHRVLTDGHDDKALSRAVHALYTGKNFRYSQLAPLSMFEEQNTRTNLPCQIDIQATHGDEYNFLMMAKGGGSANKFFLYQQTKAILREDALMKFLEEKLKTIGTAACALMRRVGCVVASSGDVSSLCAGPPYHLALVIGGLSADQTMKTTKLASAGYLDRLPRTGNALGRAFRDVELEERVHKLTQRTGIGAQFGGKVCVWYVRQCVQ